MEGGREGAREGGRERAGGGIDEMSRMRGQQTCPIYIICQHVISQSSGVMIQRRYLQLLSILFASPL